ncbi:MAG: YhgE/Pip domain-containing protein [Coriobacteriaceae bacterium]|nr:YhgE/Pip domain-containing protein [Coriobacteriaceae bacterium]
MADVRKAFQIFKRDLIRLLKNPVAMIITIGVCIIPSLYAWYNIVANWDPYGNTGNVKVAVANNDKGTSNEYVGELNAGKQTVDKLRENDQIGWTFVDETKAKQGVESGEYYAAIVIPKDFSKDLTSMLTGEFHEPKLAYYVNEKKNAIAPKVTDTGAETVEEQINETFVSTVAKTLVEKVQEAGGTIDDQGEAVHGGLMASVKNANGALGDVRKSLGGMQGTISKTKVAVSDADKTLADLSGQVPSLTKALQQGDGLLSSTRESARTFTTSLSSVLTAGMGQLGSISSQANSAIGGVTGSISAAGGKVDGALADVQGVIDTIQGIIDDIKKIPGIDHSAIVKSLEEQLGKVQKLKDALQTQSTDIQNTVGAIGGVSASLDKAAQKGIGTVSKAQEDFSKNVSPKLASGLDSFSAVSGDLQGIVAGVSPTIDQVRGTLSQLTATLDQASGAIKQTDKSLGKLQGNLDKVVADVAALRSSKALEDALSILDIAPDDMAGFMASPVNLKTKPVYPVVNYGSGVAPFYTNLALWVGGFVLIAIFKLEVDEEGLGEFSTTQAYFGRWLLMVLLGAVQAAVVCAGDLFLGIQCLHPALFMLAGIFTSFVFVNIIYALAIAFKHIGKAIAVILVIVQIPGSSGMYPIEMMPTFFQCLHPLLPFTYGINAMRETIGGMYGMDYWIDLGILVLFLLGALFVGVVVRPLAQNLNLLFDRQLARTGVMICEKDDRPSERISLRTALYALLDTAGYREVLLDRAARFERKYPYLIKAGFVLVFGLPVVLFILTAALDLSVSGKIVMLCLWILSIILADTYMIVVEYLRESLMTQLHVASMSEDDVRAEVHRRMGIISKDAPAIERARICPEEGAAKVSAHSAASPAHLAQTPHADQKGGDAR